MAFEAAKHGVPVTACDEVGALPYMLEYCSGTRCLPGESRPYHMRQWRSMLDVRKLYNQGALAMERDLHASAFGKGLLDLYNQVISERRGETVTPPMGNGMAGSRQ